MIERNGGDDGARTRDLRRNRSAVSERLVWDDNFGRRVK